MSNLKAHSYLEATCGELSFFVKQYLSAHCQSLTCRRRVETLEMSCACTYKWLHYESYFDSALESSAEA